MKNAVQINRDPFARASLMREKATGECRWCGQPARFRYFWDADGRTYPNIRRGPDHAYCSISCYRSLNS